MNYILIGVVLIAFTGCGSSDTEDKKEVIASKEKEVINETSPQNVEKSKTPPAIPKI